MGTGLFTDVMTRFTLALNNQVRIFANLLADVAVRYPAAFAVTAPVTQALTQSLCEIG